MPFAGYEDFADCVAQNQDKDDPEAYCAIIEAAVMRHMVLFDQSGVIRDAMNARTNEATPMEPSKKK